MLCKSPALGITQCIRPTSHKHHAFKVVFVIRHQSGRTLGSSHVPSSQCMPINTYVAVIALDACSSIESGEDQKTPPKCFQTPLKMGKAEKGSRNRFTAVLD
ncbi:hypothetical protein HBH70_235140 [Parastagonospora nodorum]|nr:hypothetical protein HBH51_213870 [Parastagonospora nodorum]KAH3991900.1 hypothetical protein HBI10_223890 [Parastagonospora nodorum]KAH4009828.1 hypothetical protein HBI13_215550 [Parastagonospora nodorum]KAH4114066.1 hypothetical protein HBH47_201030 [Parastagonospora nodorum]KAH4285846.1 hypothetical protein HBI02_225580 [Parastagonospora nodorum]